MIHGLCTHIANPSATGHSNPLLHLLRHPSSKPPPSPISFRGKEPLLPQMSTPACKHLWPVSRKGAIGYRIDDRFRREVDCS
ncbi:hypothetical protein AVEN_98320-1 [Araneus ventricosus]|uniref:Uncharacterized protein n=1 Tax=Araneus ventricosus TaxID=182803 RepID=A0A4Y2QZR6_ARAVE|nr:hypothetical protein AVEN_98320-1 [Araneus ventricosus]